MELNKEFVNVTDLRAEIHASSCEEMLGKAIALTLRCPAQHRAELFESLMQEIAVVAAASQTEMKPWVYFVHIGTDGSRIFRGGVGTSLVIDLQGRLWRARTYEDFETTYIIENNTCEIDTIKPNYALMREYVVR